MTWKKLYTETKTESQQLLVVGECNRCHQCCVCWIYDRLDQPTDVLPRKGWCPELDLEKKTCRIWDKRPEGCRSFPTVKDFELGAVPATCGFRVVQGSERNGQICQP
ncbi:YkgJ family cysteine cluster protein [Dehalococcoides mccartyi]|uniref:YkgJ family cysteine cluster protein n=1 Tax=Dehalococcoides mccartyi TaxID=61435 RepID=UPI0012AB5C77